MKIALLGYSGSGKSTLARALAERCGVPALHLDAVQFLPGWRIRPQEEQLSLVRAFMDENEEAGWVIDGNYANLLQPRRLEEADRIVLLLFNRFSSLARVTERYRRFRGKSRPDMTEGCAEKLDAEFLWWVLWRGRTRPRRAHYAAIAARWPDKCVILKNQRQIDAFLRRFETEPPSNIGKE
ncbi:MAG: AAA family ATPase [Oscillospiraceae bacterium]|nr:AAA family ATPase [Oscillospiraceae bacterium]